MIFSDIKPLSYMYALILYETYMTEQLCDILGREAHVIHICFDSICNLRD